MIVAPIDEPPTLLDINGRTYDLLNLQPLERARLAQELKLANAAFAYWIYRGNAERPFEAWTLFLTGPWLQEWGFKCGERFVPWQQFTKPNAPGEIGRGCG